MPDGNFYQGKPLPVSSDNAGANFMSPLQKASNVGLQSTTNRCWLSHCYEVLISAKTNEPGPVIPIEGGSDAGMFCVIGSQLDPSRFDYHGCSSNMAQSQVSSSLLKPGDIILTLNEYEISGYTRRDAIELCDVLAHQQQPVSTYNQSLPRLRLRLSPSNMLPTGSTMLSSFLSAAFTLNSPEYALQERIRENVYQRVVPCTTRLPRADEVDGVHYRFMSVPQFMELEGNGQLLESGVYKGNHYGTPRPDPSATALDSVFLARLSVSTSSSAQVFDDSCMIPPPLPPLASLSAIQANNNNGSNNTSASSESSSITGSHLHQQLQRQKGVRHPPAPPPPIRNSSIVSQSSQSHSSSSSSSVSNKTNGHSSRIADPLTSSDATQPRSSIDLGPLSSKWNGLQSCDSTNYLIDCDINPSHWKVPGLGVTDPNTTSESQTGKLPLAPPALKECSEPTESLPYGWEIVRDPRYGTFYIDHIHRRTQYEPPTEADFEITPSETDGSWRLTSRETPVITNLGTNKTVSDGPKFFPTSDGDSSISVDRITPNLFTTDPQQLDGPIVTTTLVKGSHGFGFTIVGGSDCNKPGFLQVKYLTPDGPASVSNCLQVGDVIVMVNGINVLGYTHADLVALLQSIPVGSNVSLTVSQAYRIRSEKVLPQTPLISNTTSVSANQVNSPAVSSADKIKQKVHLNSQPGPVSTCLPTVSSAITSPHLSVSSACSSPHISGSDRASDARFSSDGGVTKPRQSQRPEFIKVSIFKQSDGFGFTLADHVQGQHVKAILDPVRCGRLRVDDVVVEINDQRVKEMPHTEVVQILKQCPVGQEARLLIQRGGLYASPANILNSERLTAHQLSLNEDQSVPPGGAVDSAVVSDAGSTRSRDSTEVQLPSGHVFKPVADDIYTFTNVNRNGPTRVVDQRRRPVDDSILDRSTMATMVDSPNSSLHYGSAIQPGHRIGSGSFNDDSDSNSNVSCTPFMMEPGEFMVHLQRQSTGFGFTVMGGAEEHSRVIIGSLVPGGAAELSGVVHTGDRLLSVNGTRVVGSKHRDVVRLLDQAMHTVGQVTLGLQRSPTAPPSGKQRNPYAVDVIVPRSHKSDGFGFFISNSLSDPSSTQSPRLDGEFIAKLVPGSKAESLGLLSVGDRILAVNGVSVLGLHHDQVVRMIRESGSHIILNIIPSAVSAWASRSNPPSNRDGSSSSQFVEFPVTLFRGSRGFGFSIRGGQEFNRMPLLVLRIADGGAAQMDGRLKVGDELVQINGFATTGMSHAQAIEIIQVGGSTMHLVVRRHVSPHKRQQSYHPRRSGATGQYPIMAAAAEVS